MFWKVLLLLGIGSQSGYTWEFIFTLFRPIRCWFIPRSKHRHNRRYEYWGSWAGIPSCTSERSKSTKFSRRAYHLCLGSWFFGNQQISRRQANPSISRIRISQERWPLWKKEMALFFSVGHRRTYGSHLSYYFFIYADVQIYNGIIA